MANFTFLVSSNYDALIKKAGSFLEEYALLRKSFEKKGANLSKIAWDEPDSLERENLIPKAVWDYFDKPDAFRTFLHQVQSQNVAMINSAKVVEWNMCKSYLQEIIQKDLPVLDLKLFERGTQLNLADREIYPDSKKVIIKPSISGGSKDTVVTELSDIRSHQAMVDRILKNSHLVIQPYYNEVEEGEYSYFFFGGDFSHAIIKVPAKGDFRAHSFFGSTNSTYSASQTEIDEAKRFIDSAPHECAYARVDLVRHAGKLHLVELELIEPYLYFELAENKERSIDQLTSAIINSV